MTYIVPVIEPDVMWLLIRTTAALAEATNAAAATVAAIRVFAVNFIFLLLENG